MSARRRILIAASDEFELAPMRQRTGQSNGCEYVYVARGPGSTLVRQAVESVGDLSQFDVIVSAGLCGGLLPNLRVGDIVIGLAVNGEPALRPDCRAPFHAGPVISVDAVAGTVEEKTRLRASGAIAVEMEAATVLSLARDAGRPFYCVKVVSDTAEEEFTLDLNAARDQAGHFRVPALLWQAACRPWNRVPEMIRLWRQASVASRRLGDFIAACQF